LGRHTACNALAAIAVARRMGVDEDLAIRSLADAHGPEMRLQPLHFGQITMINDAYNANPNSMRAALETIANLPTRGRRIVVVGDMKELGAQAARYHQEIGEYAAACKLDLLACIGKLAGGIAQGAQRAGMPVSSITR